MNRFQPLTIMLLLAVVGCGTTKWTDTTRSATEQLLISDAMDRAVSRLDFRSLAGKIVYLDDTALRQTTDAAYLISTLRQHLLASGCVLKDDKNDADYVVEARAGAVGTDRHDLLYGFPAVNIPAIIPVSGFGIPSQIPEMPFIKKTDQRAVAKIAVFAYNRRTGRPVWQSGTVPIESKAKAVWVMGAGPFQRGTIYDGMNFAGDRLRIPLIDLGHDAEPKVVSVADEAFFVEPQDGLATDAPAAAEGAQPSPGSTAPAGADSGGTVVPATHTAPATDDQEGPATTPTGNTSSPEAPAGELPPAPVPLEPSEPGVSPGWPMAGSDAGRLLTTPEPQTETTSQRSPISAPTPPDDLPGVPFGLPTDTSPLAAPRFHLPSLTRFWR